MIEFRSSVSAVLVDLMGDDRRVVESARVSSGAETVMFGEQEEAMVAFLARNNHTSPFEHNAATFLFEVPIFVAREHMRHRTQSYNEESGRWRVLEPVFYLPDDQRPTKQVGRTGEYSFVADPETNGIARMGIARSCSDSYATYQEMLDLGVAKEVARMVLPVNIFTRYYATANLLNWIKFCKLRTDPTAMHEIRVAASMVRDALMEVWPASMSAYGFTRPGVD